ncbi:MAG TPA: hypothetical protein VFM49_12515 [Chloroflexia bacterium]|jgi:hypothetical protein|nr:hypothetical protein [Chloroflexia bacterium]
MHEDWIKREVRSFTSAAASLLNKNAPKVELPIAPHTAEGNPPPQDPPAAPPRSRRTARRRRKQAKR